MVIVDSSVWIDYLKRPDSQSGETLQSLIRTGSVLLVGPVLTELLQGARSPVELDRIEDMLQGVEYLETTRDTWVRAGLVALDLRSAGQTLPVMDVTIAAIALEGGHSIYTRDPDFNRIPGVRLYDPDKEPPNA
jgi:hypothetical protein